MSRIRPSGPADWTEETRAILGRATPAAESADGEGPPNILYTIGHHPSLLAPFLAFSSALALRGVLPRRDSELLALRAAWNCGSAFEWGHHVEYARAEGLTPRQIEAIAEGPEAAGWSAADRLLLAVADELHARQHLSDERYAALAERFTPAEIVEIVFVVGQYTMLSMVANATGVPCETRLPTLPSR